MQIPATQNLLQAIGSAATPSPAASRVNTAASADAVQRQTSLPTLREEAVQRSEAPNQTAALDRQSNAETVSRENGPGSRINITV